MQRTADQAAANAQSNSNKASQDGCHFSFNHQLGENTRTNTDNRCQTHIDVTGQHNEEHTGSQDCNHGDLTQNVHPVVVGHEVGSDHGPNDDQQDDGQDNDVVTEELTQTFHGLVLLQRSAAGFLGHCKFLLKVFKFRFRKFLFSNRNIFCFLHNLRDCALWTLNRRIFRTYLTPTLYQTGFYLSILDFCINFIHFDWSYCRNHFFPLLSSLFMF